MAQINVTKRGSFWQYRFEAAKVNGKRKQISKSGFRTKKEALEAGTKALAEYNRSGIHFEPSDISVSDYLDYWFDNYCKIELGYNTQLAYLSIIENHLKPRFGIFQLSALTTASIQPFANDLKLNGISRSHLTGILSVLSAALDYAVEPLHYIQFNPAKSVRTPKIEKKPRERIILKNEEFEQIVERFPATSRFYIPLMIGYYTGVRISECFGLTWDDIDLENRTITIQHQSAKRNYGVDARKVLKEKGKKEEKSAWYLTNKLKTKTSARTLKFGDTLYHALKDEKNRQLQNELQYGEFYTIHVLKPEDDGRGNILYRIIPLQKCVECQYNRCRLVCIDENGEYTTTDSFKYCSRVIHNQLHIAFDYHSLRHTHATKLIEAGASVKSVSARLGHTNVETTMNIYVHNTEVMEDHTVELFEKSVGKIV